MGEEKKERLKKGLKVKKGVVKKKSKLEKLRKNQELELKNKGTRMRVGLEIVEE